MLQHVPAPPDVLNTYQQSLLDFMGQHPPEVQLFHLPVGTLGLAELAQGATLDGAVASGSRILAAWPDGTWTSCEMTDPTQSEPAEFRNFVQGDYVPLVFARIAEAQGLDAMQNADYDLNFLSLPGIYFEGLHLVCKGQGIDLVLPVLSFDSQLGTGAVFDAGNFLALAGAIASARLALTSHDPLSS